MSKVPALVLADRLLLLGTEMLRLADELRRQYPHSEPATEWGSIERFIKSSPYVGRRPGSRLLRSTFYNLYRQWCAKENFLPLAKRDARRQIEACGLSGVRCGVVNGYDCVLRVAANSATDDEL